jgi:hypothetical protein
MKLVKIPICHRLWILWKLKRIDKISVTHPTKSLHAMMIVRREEKERTVVHHIVPETPNCPPNLKATGVYNLQHRLQQLRGTRILYAQPLLIRRVLAGRLSAVLLVIQIIPAIDH